MLSALALVLATLPAPGGAAWTPAQTAALTARIEPFFQAATLRGAQIGFLAVDTMRGKTLNQRNPDQEFIPASNFKLIVGSTALEKLGPAFAFRTQVLRDGTTLYLRGGGDPLLSIAELQSAARTSADATIGNVVTDISYFEPQGYLPGWAWDDFPYYYSPLIGALELEEGVVHVTLTPGAAVGEPVQLRVWPQTSVFTIENSMRTGPRGSKDTSDIARPFDRPNTIVLTGSYPLGAKESDDIVPAVPDPERYTGDVFLNDLKANGAIVNGVLEDGITPATATVVWTLDGERFPQLLRDFWYHSDNLIGETLLRELGVAQAGTPGTAAHGAEAEIAFLRRAGIDPATVTIADGSGLSQYNRITPRDFVKILQYDWNGPHRAIVLRALPVSVGGNVYAKTGSFNHTRTLSGFVRTRTHGPVTFSLLVNQWMGGQYPSGNDDLDRVRNGILSAIAQQ